MKMFKKFLLPHIFIFLLLIIISFFGLLFIFYNDISKTILAYCLYTISTYTLIIVIYRIIYYWSFLKEIITSLFLIDKLRRNDFINEYFENIIYRTNISLYNGFGMNVIYSLFKFIVGLTYNSIWEISIGLYYTMLSFIKLNLVRVALKSENLNNYYKKEKHEIINYVRTGYLLFALNISMSGMVVQMIWQNKSYIYPGYLIYISAFYTFYSFITTVIHIGKYKKYNNYLFYATNLVNFAGAFMSMFVLQTAMLTQFGHNPLFQRIMNIMTGTFIMVVVLFIGIIMVIHGKKKLRELKGVSFDYESR